MAIIYYPATSQILQRTTSGSNYTEIVISTVPNSVFFFDTGSQISSLSASSLSVTASYAISALSASYAPGNPSLSASWAALALTASYAVNGGGSGTTLSTGSSYPITSSWATNVVNGGAGTTLSTGSTYPITSSWSSNVISSSYAASSSYVTEYVYITRSHSTRTELAYVVEEIAQTAATVGDGTGYVGYIALNDKNNSGSARNQHGILQCRYDIGPSGLGASQSYNRVTGLRVGGSIRTTGAIPQIFSVHADNTIEKATPVTDTYGYFYNFLNNGGAVISSLYGNYINIENTSGSITDAYLIRLNAITGSGTVTNRYGIYQAGPLDSNYFAGAITASRIVGNLTGLAQNAISASWVSGSAITNQAVFASQSNWAISSSWASASRTAVTASNIIITDIGNSNTEYGIVFLSDTAANTLVTNGGGTSLMSFNPGTNTLKVGNLIGSASYATTASYYNYYDVTVYSESSSYASSSFLSQFSSESINATQSIRATWATQSLWATNSLNAVSASWVSGSITGSFYGTASWAVTASYALNGSGGGSLSTGSTYPVTSSWAETGSYMSGSNFRIVGNELQVRGSTPSGSWFKLEVYEDPLGTGSLQLTFVV